MAEGQHRSENSSASSNTRREAEGTRCPEQIETLPEHTGRELEMEELSWRWKLAQDAKSSKKSFFKYLSSKRRGKGSMVPLVKGVGALVTQDVEKTEVHNPFSASFSLARFSLRPPRSPSLTICGSKAAEEGGVTNHLGQLAVHKSSGLNGLH